MNKLFKVLILLFVFLFFNNVSAYTKEDIVELGKSIKVCSTDTKEMVDDLVVSYTKLINERDISESNIDVIYNNLNMVIDIVNTHNVCTESDLYNLPEDIKSELKDLYSKTNKILKSSPKLVDNTIEDINIVINDGNIEIYSGDVLKDVVSKNAELNYVGLNKNLVFIFIVFVALFVLSIIKLLIKKDIFTISILYVCILCLGVLFIFRNEISLVLDFIPNSSKDVIQDVVVNDKTIVSYPSYGNRYGKIIIGDEEDNIFYGDSKYILNNGVATSTKYSLPGIEKTVLSGHNTGIFKKLFDISGNLVLETSYGKFTYEIENTRVVENSDIDALNEDYDLILYTCYPNINIYGNKRLVVYAKLIDSEWENK